jgi:hypothetical protein
MSALTALLVVLGSVAATPGLNEAVSVANGLVSASHTSGQRAHSSVTDNFDLELTDEVKRCVFGIVPTPCCFLECGNKKLAPTRLFCSLKNYFLTSYYHFLVLSITFVAVYVYATETFI